MQTYSVKKLTRSARGVSPSRLQAKIQGYIWQKSYLYTIYKREPMEITEIPLLKIVTDVHFVGFFVF